MAPEVLRAEKSVSEKSDVYSFAVVLWEISTGRLPWGDLGHMQILFSVGMRGERLAIPKDVQPEVSSLIQDCWAEDPSKRPGFEDILTRLSSIKEIVVSSEPVEVDEEEEEREITQLPHDQFQPSLPPLQGPSHNGW